MLTLLTLLVACSGTRATRGAGERCACEGDAPGAQLCLRGDCGPCACLPPLEPTPDPEPSAVFFVTPGGSGDGSEADPWGALDWPTLDAALAAGDVHVYFDASGTWDERVDVSRTDLSAHRLVLDGRGMARSGDGWRDRVGAARASVPGVHTGFDDIRRSWVTVRGFEVTGSDDKGVYWRAGDGLLLEDLVVHDNGGTPAVSFDYVSRSGLPAAGITLRSLHVFDQTGECIYIGGAEGEDIDAHEDLLIEGALIHDCTDPLGTRNDGVNVKDRIRGVTLRQIVVFHADWGIEVGSPALIESVLTFDVERDGFHLNDAFHVNDIGGPGLSGTRLRDVGALRAGEDALYIASKNTFTQDLLIEGALLADSPNGLSLGGEHALEMRGVDVQLFGNRLGVRAWGDVELSLDCEGADNEALASGVEVSCAPAARPSGLEEPAGPDGVYFTDDDPWRLLGDG